MKGKMRGGLQRLRRIF